MRPFFRLRQLDDWVDMRHGTGRAATLRSNGVQVEWMLRSDDGHG